MKIYTYSGLLNLAKEIGQDPVVLFSVISSNEQTDRYRKICRSLKKRSFFEFEGEYYKGSIQHAALEYIFDNPESSDFSVWLRNNYPRYTQLQ